jgi:hypothetical protein
MLNNKNDKNPKVCIEIVHEFIIAVLRNLKLYIFIYFSIVDRKMGSPSSAEAEDAILFGEPAASSHWSAIEQQKIGREYEGEPSSADDHHELDQLLSEWLLTGQQENGDGGGDWQIAQLNACVYGVLESLSTFTARLILSALLQRLVYAFGINYILYITCFKKVFSIKFNYL